MQNKQIPSIATDDFLNRHFNSVCSVYTVCNEHALSKEDARLYSYIHIKALERQNEFTETPNDESIEIDALKAMLGVDGWRDSRSIRPQNKAAKGVIDAFISVSDEMKHTDLQLREEHGLEFRLHSELYNRLRFHTDSDFRSEKLNFYRSKILTALNSLQG